MILVLARYLAQMALPNLVSIKQALSKTSEDLKDAVKAKKLKKAKAKPRSDEHNTAGSDDRSSDKDA
jgi:hypothetical protein